MLGALSLIHALTVSLVIFQTSPASPFKWRVLPSHRTSLANMGQPSRSDGCRVKRHPSGLCSVMVSTQLKRTNCTAWPSPTRTRSSTASARVKYLTSRMAAADNHVSFAALPEKMCQTAMNIAAITGPRTNPLIPKIEMPPSVEKSTT
jgi:hypothetical protein